MKDDQKELLEMIALSILAIIPVAIIAWVVYKVLAGVYHLLDKLIDKI